MEETFDRARLIVEAAFIQASLKYSRNWKELKYKRELIANFRKRAAKMETQADKDTKELVLENAYLLARQTKLKLNNINANTRLR